MIADTKIKICGLTRPEDAQVAAEIGADYLGFIFYPKSSRAITLKEYDKIRDKLPQKPARVAVVVEPALGELEDIMDRDFDVIQYHFTISQPIEELQFVSECVGLRSLWLAPNLPKSHEINEDWLPISDAMLIDTFSKKGFGGTGKTGDWERFVQYQNMYSDMQWILAGGLNPSNVLEALRETGAKQIDVNSGVESAPGIKDAMKLRHLRDVILNRDKKSAAKTTPGFFHNNSTISSSDAPA